MAAAPDPEEVLCSTDGKANFQRLVRLLISGGTNLLREVFDIKYPPSTLHTILGNPATKNQLKAAKLTKPQWDCLYRSPGVCGKSTDFDITLLFRLLRTICGLSPPSTGWDVLPASADHSLTADLARIKYYRNSVYGHVKQEMEITDDDFLSLWQEISETLVRIAGHISHTKVTQWKQAIDDFLGDPLTEEDKNNVEELERWYKNDIKVKNAIEELKAMTQELKTIVVQEVLARLKAEGKTDSITENVQCLLTPVREEAQGIKDHLGERHQPIDKLSSSSACPQPTGAQLRLRIDCEIITKPGIRTQKKTEEMVGSPQEPLTSVQEAARISGTTSSQAQAVVKTVFGEEKVGNGRVSAANDVLDVIALKCFQPVDPSKPDELNGYRRYITINIVEGEHRACREYLLKRPAMLLSEGGGRDEEMTETYENCFESEEEMEFEEEEEVFEDGQLEKEDEEDEEGIKPILEDWLVHLPVKEENVRGEKLNEEDEEEIKEVLDEGLEDNENEKWKGEELNEEEEEEIEEVIEDGSEIDEN